MFFNKEENTFEINQVYDDQGNPLYVEYTEEAYNQLFDCPPFYYVTQDSKTLLPVQTKMKDEEIRRYLRNIRRRDIFPIIDRPLWFEELTEEQKEDIRRWRREWLEAPETLEMPKKPTWLEE